MTWLDRLFQSAGRDKAQEPVNAGPIVPFEQLVDRGPPLGVGLQRPLVYAFEHVVLVDAFFGQSSELDSVLVPRKSDGAALRHLWSMSAVKCATSGGWDLERDDDIEAFWRYAEPLMASVSIEPHIGNPISIWTVQTPPPRALGETYFIAMCYVERENSVRTPDRFFTLEASVDVGSACFCEWTREGSHFNFGPAPVTALHEFALAALRRAR